MAKRFFTSDNHFFHNNIMKYCPVRMFANIQEHDKKMIENWNKVVKPEDEVWVLGDFAFAELPAIKNVLAKLNGTKHLIVGNHDKHNWSDYVRAGFESVQRFRFINIKGVGAVALAHDPSCCIVDPTVPWLVGHLHQQFIRFGNAINVGVDVRGLAPVSEEQLAEDFRITIQCHMNTNKDAEKEILGKE